jgi:outer membrane protein OmpA-like peptidoglycan-associated protein
VLLPNKSEFDKQKDETNFQTKGGIFMDRVIPRKWLIVILIVSFNFIWGCHLFEYRRGAAYSPSDMPDMPKRFDKVTLHLHFSADRAIVNEGDYRTLDSVVDLIRNRPSSKVIVEGHTDNIGEQDRNHELSHDRANAVKNYFVQQGIEESIIRTVGYGESKPIASNANEWGRYQNRRVEILLVSE